MYEGSPLGEKAQHTFRVRLAFRCEVALCLKRHICRLAAVMDPQEAIHSLMSTLFRDCKHLPHKPCTECLPSNCHLIVGALQMRYGTHICQRTCCQGVRHEGTAKILKFFVKWSLTLASLAVLIAPFQAFQ